MKEKLKVSSFCSGVGSPEFAMDELSKEFNFEHEITFACEINKYARASYLANFQPELMIEDMTKDEFDGTQFYSDVNISGLPCQAFSLAGLRKGELDPRGLLFYDFYRYVKKQQPKAFIIENVKGLLSDSSGKTFQNWLLMLGDSVNGHMQMFNHELSLGYNLHWTVLNTKDFGIPQNRERVFLVGIRPDIPNTFRFPVGFPLKLRLKDILEPVVDEKYYLSDKMVNVITHHQNIITKKDTPEISASIHAGYFKMDGRDQQYLKEEPVCVAMRGRNMVDGKRKDVLGADTEQQLEVNSGGTTNCISTVQKDNLIIEQINNSDNLTQFCNSQDMKLSPLNGLSQTVSAGHFNQPKIILDCVGNLSGGKWDKTNEQSRRVYNPEGISPGINTMGGGNQHCKIILNKVAQLPGFESTNRVYDSDGISSTVKANGGGLGGKSGLYKVSEATKKGYDIATEGDSINLQQPNSETRRGRVGKQIANTIETMSNQATISNHRIRRLTPKEVWRLQGFSDEAFYKAKQAPMSDSQLYRQAGNSMSTPVIKAIIKNVLNCIAITK
jgi:DNA (cytosine-5)-methyltransferase 1